MSTTDVSGPIDLLVVEFPANADRSAVGAALLDLVDGGTIRLYDLMLVHKDAAGVVTELGPVAADPALAPLAGARSGLVDADDLSDVTAVLDADTTAAVLVYENTWAVPFVAAALEAGGQLVASSRLTAQAINDALDLVERGN
jgi:hypothetical protein